MFLGTFHSVLCVGLVLIYPKVMFYFVLLDLVLSAYNYAVKGNRKKPLINHNTKACVPEATFHLTTNKVRTLLFIKEWSLSSLPN